MVACVAGLNGRADTAGFAVVHLHTLWYKRAADGAIERDDSMKKLWIGLVCVCATAVGVACSGDGDAPGDATTSTTATGGAGGEAAGGVCGSETTYDDADYDACVSDSCCTSFNACDANDDCAACIVDPETAGCDTDGLFDAYYTCTTDNCAESVCDSGIVETNDDGSTNFACNTCVSENCCTDVAACVGDGSEAAVDLCLSCLADPDAAECSDDAVKAGANGYWTCAETSCATPCGL